MDVIFSVIVCTYNRADLLKGCLDSLCQQRLDSHKYEIIVVDNNSSDDTQNIVEGYYGKTNIYCFVEMQLGLSHARNRGIIESQGQYLAYLDDDARATSDWLEVAYNAIQSNQPHIDCISGPILPFYTSSQPIWFKDEYEIRGGWDMPKYLGRDGYISGSNMIWAKDTIKNIGGFNIKAGMVGNQLGLGEETDAFEKLWMLMEKPRILFLPNLVVYHWVPNKKFNVLYRLKRKFVEGHYRAYKQDREGFLKQFAIFYRLLYYLVKSIIRFLLKYGTYNYWQNWVIEDGTRIAFYSGKLFGLLGINLVSR